jgi:hypothetical protein
MGKGDKDAADAAAVEAMRKAFDILEISGEIVIGEGERDEAPMLYSARRLAPGDSPSTSRSTRSRAPTSPRTGSRTRSPCSRSLPRGRS